jgi:hypothetical protein
MGTRITGPVLLAAGAVLAITDYAFRWWAWRNIISRHPDAQATQHH